MGAHFAITQLGRSAEIMNKADTLFHLSEGLEELQKTIEKLRNLPDYSEHDFRASMSHLYHHLNTAWNARNVSHEAFRDCADSDFNCWRKFPKEDSLFLDIEI